MLDFLVTIAKYFLLAIFVAIGLYIATRIFSVAWFKSKHDFDNEKGKERSLK